MSGEALDQVKEYPLSDGDIRRLLGGNIKILTYPQLKGLRSINQAFDDQGRGIVLFLVNGPTSGHWCCLIKRADSIEFFDPYGDTPAEIKDEIPSSRLEELDMASPYLSRLLKQSGLPIYYNTHCFQSKKGDINTCGRHCVVRLLYAPDSVERYAAIIKSSGLTADDFVSGLTYDRLKR